MKTTTSLPPNYAKCALLEPSKQPAFLIGAVLAGLALLLISGWLLALFTNVVRPSALDGMRLGDLIVSSNSGVTFMIPPALFLNSGTALIGVLFIHELAHGFFYWLFSRRRPKFGFRGAFPYTAAPAGVYFPRKQFLAVGLAPFGLLSVVGLLLIVIAPIGIVPFLLFFLAFNAAGAAGDLIMVIQLMSFSSDTLMEDNQTGVTVYAPRTNAD